MKHLVCFPIPHPHDQQVCRLMHRVAGMTHTKPLCDKLEPHISIYRPLVGVDEKAIENIVRQEVNRIRSTTITLGPLSHFGKEYIVLPVCPTLGVAMLWNDISWRLSQLAGGAPDAYTYVNTLHVDIAKGTTHHFKHTWPQVQKIETPYTEIALEKVTLYGKVPGEKWALMNTFSLPSR